MEMRCAHLVATTVVHRAALCACRKLPQAYTRVQAGNYSLTPLVGSELRGKTVGVLGTGAIGTEAARMFKVRS
jgi:lactate dehydrogenase-like 2-hydroxyacid dehydrogenase